MCVWHALPQVNIPGHAKAFFLLPHLLRIYDGRCGRSGRIRVERRRGRGGKRGIGAVSEGKNKRKKHILKKGGEEF